MSHPRIIIETIDADKARISGQTGDWSYDDAGNLYIQVVAQKIMPNVKGSIFSTENFLIALHELVEAHLCLKDGVTQQAVDDFDMAFQGDGEPGDHPDAPYRSQHRHAMLIEHLMANFLGHTDYGRID